MEIILKEDVVNLGYKNDIVTVKSGYGRNYLIPQGKAVVASADKIQQFEQRRAELEKKAAEALAAAQPELARGVAKGVLHKNTASRKFGRLTKAVAKLA